MAKIKPKKSKQTQKSGSRRQDKVETTTSDHWQITQSQIGICITAAIVVIIYHGEILLSRRRVTTIQQQSHRILDRKDAFLQWFIKNGGEFHPILLNNDDDNSTSANVTIEEFPSYGGWGLSLPLPQVVQQQKILEDCEADELSHDDRQQQCSIDFAKSINNLPSPIIRHLDPLFTVPSSIIISVQSILDTYTSSDFYTQVNTILTSSFPQSTGLAPAKQQQRGVSSMGLVEQDVVIAMYLVVEECQHKHHQRLFNNIDSYWAEYLDVLPHTPRLDTFNDEEYETLNDAHLEYTGRNTKRTLQKMYNGYKEQHPSLRNVVEGMIRQKMASTMDSAIPESCSSFETFHRFVAVVSSRAMVLKGVKHLTPLAEMINYSPLKKSKDWIRAPPFDVYHSLSDDGSVTVRSDRDIVITDSLLGEDGISSAIQVFEDYGPVDSSLFLEAHGFVPNENPNNCATIQGSFFLRHILAKTGRYDENADLVLHALKALHLIHPDTERFDGLQDACVMEDLQISDDGNVIGHKPASDAIAIVSLLFGNGNNINPTWKQIETEYGQPFADLRYMCITAIESKDTERIEIRCARYVGSGTIVKEALREAASLTMKSFEEQNDTESKLQSQLEQAESHDTRKQLALALRFRLEERKILSNVAAHLPGGIDIIPEENVREKATSSANPDNLEQKVLAFNSFLQELELPVNKITARVVGDGMRIGAFAAEDIELDEPYISFSRGSIFDADIAVANVVAISSEDDRWSPLAALLKKYMYTNGSRNDGFDVLLLYLLHEQFVIKEESFWWPYLDLLPSLDELSEYHPLFFEEEDIDRYMSGSDVRGSILNYQWRAAKKHNTLSSDLDANIILGSDVLLDKRKVLWAIAIIDSRSIWWDGKRHMVPLLDLVNADIVGRPHETKIEQGDIVTRASRHIAKGEQVLENYGQPNHLLFMYHGFRLEHNENDCALLNGITINHNDPGIRHARQLRSLAPSFCISSNKLTSIEEVAKFLRVKYDLQPLESNSIDDNVRSYLIQVLETRIDRLEVEEALRDNMEVDALPRRLHSMIQIVTSDLIHFQQVLDFIQNLQ